MLDTVGVAEGVVVVVLIGVIGVEDFVVVMEWVFDLLFVVDDCFVVFDVGADLLFELEFCVVIVLVVVVVVDVSIVDLFGVTFDVVVVVVFAEVVWGWVDVEGWTTFLFVVETVAVGLIEFETVAVAVVVDVVDFVVGTIVFNSLSSSNPNF